MTSGLFRQSVHSGIAWQGRHRRKELIRRGERIGPRPPSEPFSRWLSRAHAERERTPATLWSPSRPRGPGPSRCGNSCGAASRVAPGCPGSRWPAGWPAYSTGGTASRRWETPPTTRWLTPWRDLPMPRNDRHPARRAGRRPGQPLLRVAHPEAARLAVSRPVRRSGPALRAGGEDQRPGQGWRAHRAIAGSPVCAR